MDPSSFDLESLSLTEVVRLQNQLSAILARRFERSLALVFSDVVGSTPYFARFGDEAGRRLQQQHFDLLAAAYAGTDGRTLDTAGDSALLAFSNVEAATETLVRFQKSLSDLICRLPIDRHWATRSGIHWGPVLTDGTVIAGDTVNLCAKVAASARPGEIRLTKAAFHELPNRIRLVCHTLGMVSLGNPSRSMELMELSWRDLLKLPTLIVIEETGERILLPEQQVITLGRLQDVSGSRANDIVIQLPDTIRTHQISRWHLEIRRTPTGLVLNSLSDKLTEIDGISLMRGKPKPLQIGSKVRLAGVVTLQFLSSAGLDTSADTATTRH
jgi:class 3 adenylate cyclase